MCRGQCITGTAGPLELIDAIVERGDFISATPALAYSRMHQEAIRSAPLENILLETDCPVAYEGEEATPSTVVRVCEQVASLKGCSVAEVAGQTTENVKRFLGKEVAGEVRLNEAHTSLQTLGTGDTFLLVARPANLDT